MMCIKMVPEEEDQVEKFIGGLPDNIQGNVIVAEPTRLQDVVRIANNLMDQKLKGYANIGGQNVARAYMAGNNEKNGYEGTLPFCNKCKLHHEGQCTAKCHNCKRIRHLARDCRSVVTVPTQGTPGPNQETRSQYISYKSYLIAAEIYSVWDSQVVSEPVRNSKFQSLLSQLEIHGARVSTEDANQKFLRSLPSAWSQVSLIMRTKPGVDSLSFDDLYNNLRVFENDVKRLLLHHLLVSNDYPHRALKNKGIVDSGCSRHMTGNKAYLAEFQDFNGSSSWDDAFPGFDGFRESLRRVFYGTKALMLPTLFILWLAWNEGDITLHVSYDLGLSLCAQVHKESVSKQGRKFAKGEPSVQREPLFDEIPEDTLDHMETEDAQDVGRTRDTVGKEKENDENILSTEDVLSTDKEKVSTDRPIVSTDGSKVSTDKQRKGTEDHTGEGSATQATQTPTSTIFGDDETIAKVLLNMSQAKAVSREKDKGVELKDIKETDRPRPTSTRSLLTLKPLPKIDPKDKGKKKIEEEDESESESDGIPEAEKKFKQLASDEEMARKVQEEWEGEEERKRLAEEEATNEALIRNYDDIKARIEADRLLAEKLQEEEREQFTIEERAKFLHDTIAAQRKFLAQQRSEAIRNRPPTKNQLRNQMMTYLKHVGNFKHSDLKTKKFEEIQALYEKIKRSDEDFISIGSAKDERLIKKMNEKGIDSSKNEMVKEESKEEESTRKRKLGTRKKMKSRKRRFRQNTSEDDSEKENDELRLCLTIAPDEDKEVDYEILDKKYPLIEWKSEYLGTKPQFDKVKHLEEINQNVVIRSNGQKRYFNIKIIPEGFERVLLGEFDTYFNQDIKISFRTLTAGLECKKKYPLRKKVLLQMLELKLESKEDSTIALELIRFVKKLVAELEPEDSDGDEEDL
ncbi:hypothetical protein Tco_0137876 [Tanacetum coccineum]